MTSQPISIRHELPNRIRFKIIGVPKAKLQETAQPLEQREGVIWVQVNEKCASLAIGYDPELLPRAALLNAVKQIFSPQETVSSACSCACSCGKAEPDKVKKASRRFLSISAVLGISVFRSSVLGLPVAQTALSPLGLIALGFSFPLIRSGIKKLRQKRIDLDGFLGAGAIAAIAAGEAMTAFEILWINSGAELLTAWTTERSRRSISEILDLTSHHTFVLVDGIEVERAVEDVVIGDTVVLHTGEKISVDGVIIKGEALLNESPITGRQEFSHKTVDDKVYSGTFVREGVIYVRAECVGDQTYLARVMHKVQEAMENRAPIEGVADRLAATLVKVGFGVTALTFVLTQSAWRAFTVLLVMACPCATVLAASTAISAAINAAARNHILIKGGRYLEEIGQCDTVCFDKTGTLTSHEPVLQVISPVDGISENDLLQLACSAETHNHHPLAQAVKAEAVRREIVPIPHTLCDYHMGMGIRAVVKGDEILVGNAKLAERYECSAESLKPVADALRDKGLTVLHVFRNNKPQGVLGLDARVRPEAAEVIKRLRSQGVKNITLITGDEASSTRRLAEMLGIDHYHASVLPEDKAEIISGMLGQGHSVLMVGDGVNDALALTRADVGVAIGAGGAEAAVEAADIALADNDLQALADVYGLSTKTLRIVRENFWIATGSNIVGVALGALGILSPVTAGLIHIAHTLGVVANSSRLLTFELTTSNSELPKKEDSNGFQRNSQTQALPGTEAPHSRENADQVRPVHQEGPAGNGSGKTAKRSVAGSDQRPDESSGSLRSH